MIVFFLAGVVFESWLASDRLSSPASRRLPRLYLELRWRNLQVGSAEMKSTRPPMKNRHEILLKFLREFWMAYGRPDIARRWISCRHPRQKP
jgi:hypothetical protein